MVVLEAMSMGVPVICFAPTGGPGGGGGGGGSRNLGDIATPNGGRNRGSGLSRPRNGGRLEERARNVFGRTSHVRSPWLGSPGSSTRPWPELAAFVEPG